MLAACATQPKPPAEADALPPPVAVPRVMPVEAEPRAPATQPASLFTLMTQGPQAAMLAYADKVRPLGGNELSTEISRIGDPGDSPTTQMQVALLLSQTRVPADLARALGLLQRVIANPSPEAQPLQPLARALAARYVEQRRVEDDRDKQVQQLRDSQRRIDQLNDRIEALRAIERSFARPAATPVPAAPAPATTGNKPTP
jgi:enoyl-CoA hydratase/carnithine racemase